MDSSSKYSVDVGSLLLLGARRQGRTKSLTSWEFETSETLIT